MFVIDGKEYVCPVEVTLGVLSDKWKIFIVHTLINNTKRFKELCETFPSITQKTVAQKLKELERDHIVVRTVFAEVPPRVEYTLSDIGAKLEPAIAQLFEFGTLYAKTYGSTC